VVIPKRFMTLFYIGTAAENLPDAAIAPEGTSGTGANMAE
jgi:hypothetical protein